MVAATRDTESRTARRTNTLLAADALIGTTRWPVKIRNMSRFGAMVETSATVSTNSSIVLKRGAMHVAGEVRWRREGLLGVRFFEPTVVEEWLGVPIREAIASVDSIPTLPASAEDLSDNILTKRIAEELGYIERLIAAVAGFLGEDPILRIRHCTRIQELSMAAEMMEQLSIVLISDDKMASIESSVTGPMKQRMLR